MAEPRPSPLALSRLSSFRVVYVAIVLFVLLSVISITAAEGLLQRHFRAAIAQALQVSPSAGPVAYQIHNRVAVLVRDDPWTRLAGVRVRAFVVGADNRPLYLGGAPLPPPPLSDPGAAFREAERLLPATADVDVSVPLASLLPAGIIVLYGVVLIQALFLYNRRVLRREQELVDAAVAARDATARRTADIERELEQVRHRLGEVEPGERAHGDEIRALQAEREILQKKLAELSDREAELREAAARSSELDQERQALEDLLEETLEDLSGKEREIQLLQASLKRASRPPAGGGRSRAAEQLGRRLRTLYKNVEIDARALDDLIALRDEAMMLRAEEGIKRLADGADSAAVRRKVGGLPPHLAIFELGFAGKGRIYYTRGRDQRHRVLAIGAKNTQNADLDYLRNLPL